MEESVCVCVCSMCFRWCVQSVCVFNVFQVVQDWKFVAQVLDRIFLWTFLTVSVMGTILIFTPAGKMYLTTPPYSPPHTTHTHNHQPHQPHTPPHTHTQDSNCPRATDHAPSPCSDPRCITDV